MISAVKTYVKRHTNQAEGEPQDGRRHPDPGDRPGSDAAAATVIVREDVLNEKIILERGISFAMHQ